MAFPIGKYNRKSERVGRMRHRVRFVSPSAFYDTLGGEVYTWVSADPVWGNVDYRQSGSEDSVIGDRITNELAALITVRYDSGIGPKSKVQFDSKEFEILSILPDPKKMYMQLECVHYSGTSSSNTTASVPFTSGFFRQEFPAHASATLTVTANGGVLPSNTAWITIFYDTGQIISPNYWTVAGSVITLNFTPDGVQSIWVEFAYN